MRILVIDDDPAVRGAFELALEDTPYGVVFAEDGRTGLERFEEGGFQLVFVDLKMPGLNGVEALRQIRGIDPVVPVFVMSGYAHEFYEELERAELDGHAVELFEKPLGRDEIRGLAHRFARV